MLERVRATLVEECEELGGVDWEWQAADTAMGKARFGGPWRPQSDRPRQDGRKKEHLG